MELEKSKKEQNGLERRDSSFRYFGHFKSGKNEENKQQGKKSLEKKALLKNLKKKKQLQKKKLIVRNLSFQVSEKELKEIFEKYGEVLEAKIPLKQDGKKRGFAFILYKDSASQIKALKELNFKEIHGRPIAIDFALSKDTYLQNLQNKKSIGSKEIHKEKESSKSKENDESSVSKEKDESSESEEKDEPSESEEKDESSESDKMSKNYSKQKDNKSKQMSAFLKEFDAGEDNDVSEADEVSSSSEYVSSDGEENVEENDKTEKWPKKQSQDVAEGKTVFIRNLSYASTEEDLKGVVQTYGIIEFCLLCIDHLTDHPKGTAFVKFKEKESADKLIAESAKEDGIFLDGRKLVCLPALSREEIAKQSSTRSDETKDKRNLRLLKCGFIDPSSKEAEGVSNSDMAKRRSLQLAKKQKLGNVNFFISDKRLAVHNIPKSMSDGELRELFLQAAGKGAFLTEARILRDLNKVDANGKNLSKGFGFVSFKKPEHALKALNHLNNNPDTFTPTKRPIVEFSIENQTALFVKEKRKEKMNMMKNKIKKAKEVTKNSSEKNQQVKFSFIKEKKGNLKTDFAEDNKVEKKKKKYRKKRKRWSDQKASQNSLAMSPSKKIKTEEKRKKDSSRKNQGVKVSFVKEKEGNQKTHSAEDNRVEKKKKNRKWRRRQSDKKVSQNPPSMSPGKKGKSSKKRNHASSSFSPKNISDTVNYYKNKLNKLL